MIAWKAFSRENLQFLNHPNATCGGTDPNNLCITDLSSYVERPDITDVQPDHRFVLGFNNYAQQLSEVFGKNQYGHFMRKLLFTSFLKIEFVQMLFQIQIIYLQRSPRRFSYGRRYQQHFLHISIILAAYATRKARRAAFLR